MRLIRTGKGSSEYFSFIHEKYTEKCTRRFGAHKSQSFVETVFI